MNTNKNLGGLILSANLYMRKEKANIKGTTM